MPEITTLSAEPRARAGKGAARATRRAGRIPGIIYGDNQEPVLISLEPREFSRALANRGFFATLIDVRVDGVVHRTLPRDVQYHPATDAPLHVDFMRLGSHARVTVTVPVVFTNPEMSPGIRRGGILNIVRHGIELSCPVDKIPDHLVVELVLLLDLVVGLERRVGDLDGVGENLLSVLDLLNLVADGPFLVLDLGDGVGRLRGIEHNPRPELRVRDGRGHDGQHCGEGETGAFHLGETSLLVVSACFCRVC